MLCLALSPTRPAEEENQGGKLPPFFARPYWRFWKEIRYLGKTIRKKEFAHWKPSERRFVALKAIKARSGEHAEPKSVLDSLWEALKKGQARILLGEPEIMEES